MNYEKIYNQIVERARTASRQKLCKNNKEYVYYEEHHIIPKCIGGSDDKVNLVLLTAREHFICHWLLIRIHITNDKLAYAFFSMCNKKSKRHLYYTPSSRMYQESKETFSNLRTGFSHTTSTKAKMSESKKGFKHSDDVKKRISDALRGRATPDDVKLKISESKKGKVSHRRGKQLSEDVKNKMKLAKIQYWADRKKSENS
jgi:hypothetical protein